MGPHTIVVKIVSEQEMREAHKRVMGEELGPKEDIWGLCAYQEGTIYVRRASRRFSKSEQLHAFWHEYFHMLLYRASRFRLAEDETLVDTLGGLQLQALQTMKH